MSAQSTILAQTIVVAQQAAEAAARAEKAASDTANKAPINSPAFTGTPTAPTQTVADNSTKLATTAYLDRLLAAANGIATLGSDGKLSNGQLPPVSVTAVYVVASQAAMLALSAGAGAFAIRTDLSNAVYVLSQTPASTLGNWLAIGTAPVLSVAGLTGAISSSDLLTALAAAPLASPTFTGTPAAPTVAGTTDNTTTIATTAFVQAVRALLAPLASPTLTGTPIAPTAGVDTNTGQLATTAFVLAQASASGDGLPVMDGNATRGAATHFARADHVHPTDSSRAPLASPTLTGTPAAPTASVDTNTTQLATTAFVIAQASASGDGNPAMDGTAARGASTHYARADHVHPTDTSRAPLASPNFTGTIGGAGMGLSGNFNALGDSSFGRASYSTTVAGITASASGGVGAFTVVKSSSGTYALMDIEYSGTQVGSITYSDSATSFNTSSDARLKANFTPYEDSGRVIDETIVGAFDWRTDPGAKGIGVLAQDAQKVFPSAVFAGDDDMDKHPGDPDFRSWSVDYSKYVPALLAEVKALRARVHALEEAK